MVARREQGVIQPNLVLRFAGFGDEALQAETEEWIARLGEEVTPDEKAATQIYDEEVFPREAERIRRAAVAAARSLELLFVTVGTQSRAPILAAIATPASYVVFLHTPGSKKYAEEAVDALGLSASEAVLCDIGDATDSAQLYKVVFGIWRDRGRPSRVAVDVTGGSKPMTAGASAVSFAMPQCETVYIAQETARKRFQVRERRIAVENPFQFFGEIDRATARALLRDHKHAAAAVAYAELHKRGDELGDRCRALLARAYASLDSLDFQRAEDDLTELLQLLPRLPSHDTLAGRAEPVRANLEGVKNLLEFLRLGRDEAERTTAALTDLSCLDFAAMLLARARAAPSHDVAALLAYRALELLPQRRLALRAEVDVADLDWERVAAAASMSVLELVDRFNGVAKNHDKFHADGLPRWVASVAAYKLLRAAFPNDIGQEENGFRVEKFEGVGRARNGSILAHGTKQLAAKDVGRIIEFADALLHDLLRVERFDERAIAALMDRHNLVELGEEA